MILKSITLSSPQENLLYDDVLLNLAEQGASREVLRFWESEQHFIVLGRISQPEQDLKMSSVIKGKIPVLRRSSGGGTVLQGKGCLNYALFLQNDRGPETKNILSTTAFVLERHAHALSTLL